MKATFIGVCKKNRFDKHAWEHTDICYEYRGHKYIITKDNNGYMGKSLKAQHEEEQRKIDEAIENKDKQSEELKYEGSAQEAFDKWFAELDG